MKSLQSKGIVESTINHPMAYIAVPIEKVLDLHVKALREKAATIENEKNEILAQFKAVPLDIPLAGDEKFLILKRQEIISAKGYQMARDATKEILWMVTNSKGLNYDQIVPVKKSVKIRYLSNLKPEEIKNAKNFVAYGKKYGNYAVSRCIDLKENLTYRLLIGDDKNAMLVWKSKIGEDMIAFWTDSEVFIRVLKAFFEALWDKATELNKAHA